CPPTRRTGTPRTRTPTRPFTRPRTSRRPPGPTPVAAPARPRSGSASVHQVPYAAGPLRSPPHARRARSRTGPVLAWQIDATWTSDPQLVTEVEVRFIPEGPGRTRVELEHCALDRFERGAGAGPCRVRLAGRLVGARGVVRPGGSGMDRVALQHGPGHYV